MEITIIYSKEIFYLPIATLTLTYVLPHRNTAPYNARHTANG